MGLKPSQSGSIEPQNLQASTDLGQNPSSSTQLSWSNARKLSTTSSPTLGDPNHILRVASKASVATELSQELRPCRTHLVIRIDGSRLVESPNYVPRFLATIF
ncbi:hypothetical protein Adt_27037 [Abeliophyllum distichum]|uniref:Uncharacterized protein n=1 Tax=Abeliophyllum distichum TaxID=126358 RepID=A0ABD1RWQ7_9LAMI